MEVTVNEHQTVNLDLTAMTVSLHKDKASFGLVTFPDVTETYTVGNDITIVYTVSADVEVSSRDWIGLYQVGWRSIDNYVWYEWSPMLTSHVAGKPSSGHVVFPASKLPKDDGEFYQFCYITSKKQVRGLSSPFQFRKSASCSSSVSDLVEIEDENGELLIIKSRTAYLDEQLKKAVERCSILNQDIKLLESEKEVLLLSKQEVDRKVSNLLEENCRHKKQISRANEQAANQSSEIERLKCNISHLMEINSVIDKEKADLEKSLSEHKSHVAELDCSRKMMINEKDALLGQIKSLEEEKALYQSHFTSTESALQAHVHRVEELQTQLNMSLAAGTASAQQREITENKLVQLSSQLEEVTASHEKCLSSIKLLEERLSEAKIEISTREKRELELKDELSTSIYAVSQLSLDLKMSRTEAETLKAEVENLRLAQTKEREDLLRQLEDAITSRNEEKREKETLLTELADVRCKLEEAATDSALYALQEANSVLKSRYLKLERKLEQHQALLNQSAARMHGLEEEVVAGQGEVRDLKERLRMGLEQYKEKVVECLKLQESCKKRTKGKSSHEGSSAEEENNMVLRLQQQMQEVAAELDRRSAKLAEMEESCMKEKALREAAEERANEMARELGVVKDELARRTATLPSMAEPLVPLPPPLQPQRIYPSMDHLERVVHETSGESATRADHQQSPASNDSQSHSGTNVRPLDSADGINSAPQSLGDVLAKCPVCDLEFTPQTSSAYRTAHIDVHYIGEMCPICNERFPPGDSAYGPHVQAHFDNRPCN